MRFSSLVCDCGGSLWSKIVPDFANEVLNSALRRSPEHDVISALGTVKATNSRCSICNGYLSFFFVASRVEKLDKFEIISSTY